MRQHFITRLGASLFAASLPLAALAQAPFPAPYAVPPPALHAAGPMPMPMPMPPTPPFLIGLQLSDTQQDQIFEILHKLAPVLREQAKTLKKAEDEARHLILAERDDESAAPAIANSIGRGVAAMHLLRLRSERQIMALLTPEQRRQLQEIPQKFKQHAELPLAPEKIAARQATRQALPNLAWLLTRNNDYGINP